MWNTWQEAMQAALYGPGGFYARGERPAAHFRTSVHTSARYAAAVLALLGHVDAALGQPAQLDVVDVGAGQGELLSQLLAAAAPPLAERIVPHAVEVAPPPPVLTSGSAGHRPRRPGSPGWSSPVSGWTTSRSTWPSNAWTGHGSCWWTPRPERSAAGP